MMEELSREYGWTPEEIRNQDYDDIVNYWKIIGIRRLHEKNKLKKHKYGK